MTSKTRYDYAKARRLSNKAHALIARHRPHVFESEAHFRAIKRIKALMMPLWDAEASGRISDLVWRAML